MNTENNERPKKFHLGAFTFGPFWGVFHGVYWTLQPLAIFSVIFLVIVLIPPPAILLTVLRLLLLASFLVSIAVHPYLGVMGYEIAANKSPEKSFKEVLYQQRWWSRAAIPVLLLVFVFVFASFYAATHFKDFGRRARTAEAKTGLTYIFASQSSHYAEFEEYSTDFEKIGVVFENQNPRYEFGFASDANPQFKKYCPDCVVSKDGFKVVAIGNIDEDETLDIWTIDQDKNLIHLQDDMKE